MIILFIIGLLILFVGVVLLIDLDKFYEKVIKWKDKVKLVVYKVLKPICEVFIKIIKIMGRTFKTAGR